MWWEVAARADEQVVGHDVDAGAIVVLRPELPTAAFADASGLSRALAESASEPKLAACLHGDRTVTVLASDGWADAWSFGATPAQLALGPSARADALCAAEKLGCGWQRLFARSPDPVLDAAIRRRGARSAAAIDEIVSAFAQELHGTVVVGGLLLPAPGVAAGRLVATGGPPQEVAVVWGPDGQVLVVAPSPAPSAPVAVASREPSPPWPSPLGPTLVWTAAEPSAQDVAHVEALGITAVVAPGALSLDGWRRLAEGGVRFGVAASPPTRVGASGAVAGPPGAACVWADPPPPAPEAEEAWEAAQAPPKPRLR